MSVYACSQLDTATDTCTEWVQVWSPSALSLSAAEGFQIASAIVLLWSIAWGFRLLSSFILNR